MFDLSLHDITDIYVETNTSYDTNWLEVTFINDKGERQQLTMYGKKGMPQLHFGEPE